MIKIIPKTNVLIKDQPAIGAHDASNHFADTLLRLAEFCVVPMTIDRYEVLV